MNNKETFYPESRFGGFTDIDGTVAFYNRVNSLLAPAQVVLDIGCGRGSFKEDQVTLRKNLRILKGKVARVIGIDVDQNAKENPFIDEFRLMQDYPWPIDNDSVDLIICDNVLEHIDAPDRFFGEIHRVLSNGGFLCLRTPNRWSYFAIAATIIPNKYHAKVTAIAQKGRKDEDVFPAFYKCNSINKLKRIFKKSGFNYIVYGYEAEPSYLSFSKLAYFFGVLHQRFAPGFLKPAIFAFGRISKESNLYK
ncbi:methyltransferase domain-containing protein [candidate division TA06 bacterium]|uniref:Methyltransferase domain-containing protein n=1 Tax=candidate division TA06 bacterium TaxID=2250710 RepID=A0A933I7U4_UNCT6|nr:methyltransferase domain-containing protein [candidate division TA06 bacterium]